MRYASIRKLDISNGEGVGISLFVQGCPFHCYNCFNQETWDFNGGFEWTEDIKEYFLDLADHPYIGRISILGGEPLCNENAPDVLELIKDIRERYGDSKKIWVYTGNVIESIDINLLTNIDVLVDGRYIDDERDLNLAFRGSANQRIIRLR